MKTFCTDKGHWSWLDKKEKDDRPLIEFCERTAYGRLCKKTVAQLNIEARNSTSAEMASLNILRFPLSKMKKKERKAFDSVFNVAMGWYDSQVAKKLLEDDRFHQNAKIIVLMREVNGAGGRSSVPEIHFHPKSGKVVVKPGNGARSE